MDRLTHRLLAVCGLTVFCLMAGCKSTKPEVPPGRGYTSEGKQIPPVGFSTDPSVPTGALATTPQSGSLMYGKGRPSTAMENYGTPTDNTYGPPGSSAPGKYGDPSVLPVSGPSDMGTSASSPPELGELPPPLAKPAMSEKAIAGSAPPPPF